MKHYHPLLLTSVLDGLFNESATATATAGASSNGAQAPTAPKKEIPPSPLKGTVFQPTKFHFKKDELGEKRPTVELLVPVPTLDGLIEKMQDATPAPDGKGTNGEKVQALVLELLANTIASHTRLQVADEKNPVNTQEGLDLSKLDLTYIANIPPAERRGGGISKETWEAFFKDYIAVMPEKTGKSVEQVTNAAKLLVARLQPVKTQKKILAFLKDQLNLWYSSTSDDSKEEFAEVFEFLGNKVDEFMKRDEAELLANL